jgi:autotransporter-associated beta strand protein
MLKRFSFFLALAVGLPFASIAHLHGQVAMTADNGFGMTSFNTSASWSTPVAPTAGYTFTDAGYRLRTPAIVGANANYTFQGDSLTLIDGGELLEKSGGGSGPLSTITVAANQNGNGGNGLTLDAGIVDTANASGNTTSSWNLAGQIYLMPNGGIIQANEPGGFTTTIAANVTSGTAGDLSIGGNLTSSFSNDVYVLAGSNNYAGATRLLGGPVQLASSAALPTGTPLVFGSATNSGGNAGVQAATLDLNGYSPTVGGLGTVSYNSISAAALSSTTGRAASSIYAFSTLPAGIQMGQRVSGASGTGTVIGIDRANDYVITSPGPLGNTLTFAATQPSGTQAITIGGTANAVITVNGATSATSQIYNFTGIISNGSTGSVALVVQNGWQELSGSNTYTGPTTVNQGELLVNGSLVSTVTVNSGGTLGGTGRLSSVLINASGHLAPGDAPGTMSLSGSLTLLSGAVMDYELDTPLDSDMVLMTSGALNLYGQQFSDFNFTPLGGFGPGTYSLVDAGSISGSLGASTSGTIDGLPANLAVQGDNLVLKVSPVPEPRTLALLVVGATLLSTPRVRRRATRVPSFPSRRDASH